MYDAEDARLQYEALLAVSKDSPVTQVRAVIAQLGREWRSAGELLADNTDEIKDDDPDSPTFGEVTYSSIYGIEVAGAVVPGMIVLDDRGERASVIRQMTQGGQLSLHLTSSSGPSGQYINLTGPASPIVVLR